MLVGFPLITSSSITNASRATLDQIGWSIEGRHLEASKATDFIREEMRCFVSLFEFSLIWVGFQSDFSVNERIRGHLAK